MVVLNTSGNGATPSTDTLQTNWNGYSFAIVALGNGATSFAEPVAFLRNANPHITPAWVRLGSFTTQAISQGQWRFFDSMGAGAPVDPQFISQKLCMTEPFDNTYCALNTSISDPAAEIVTLQIANNPVHPMACP